MLPYHLRVPVYGKSNDDIKKNAKEEKSVAARGGPVQVAIEEDILLLQSKYVNELQGRIGQAKHLENEGFAFGIFRELFANSKAAMLHLLLPKSSCDKEAYSQLIYASCLQVFRQAFKEIDGTELSLENAGFALFCLFALYQTNPLPRETKSPFELLSMGLQGDENYRSLYRRVFRQNIRIDHDHYGLLLRLRHLCLARIDGCGRRYYGQMLQNNAENTFKCNCAIARDTIHVMDMLSARWEYCDYTGPVGLEGLAGHADYVATESDGKTTATLAPMESTVSSTGFQLSMELKQSLQAYQNSVKEIRVPTGRNHTTTKVRKSLENFFATTRKDPLSHVEARLFGSSSSGHKDTQEHYGNDEEALRDKTEDLDELNSRLSGVGEKSIAGGNNADAVLPAFKSIVPPGLHDDTKKYLHQALGSLFERQLPFLQTTAIVGGQHADDVSSVGFGGISVATGGGGNALRALLSKANANKGVPSRVGAANTSDTRQIENNASIQFLAADNTLLDQADSDDEGSEVSNISLSDYEDDDENKFDDASVATSAAGRQALSSLLYRVNKTQAEAQKPASSKKRKSTARKRTPPTTKGGNAPNVARSKTEAKGNIKAADLADAASTCTSIGGGQNALAALLGEAQQMGSSSEGTRRRNMRREKSSEYGPQTTRQLKRSRVTKEAQKEVDAMSVASSIGNGQNALGNLLAQARNTNKAGSNTDETSSASSVRQGEHQDSESVATSTGPGKGALDALLGRVTKSSDAERSDDDS